MKTSLRKDQRGVAHLVLIVLAVVVLGGIGFAAYRIINKEKDSVGSRLSSEEAQKIAAECKQEIDDEEFCKFASSFLSPDSYTAVMETEGANGSSTTTLKSSGDNTQMTATSDGQIVADYITIGNTSYVKDLTDNQWTKYTNDDTYKVDDLKDDIKVDFSKDEADGTEYKQVAKEACGDLTCFKYQIVDPSADSSDQQFIWFDDEDYLIRKWQFTNGEGTTTATFTYEDVDIKEPSPIKEASAAPANDGLTDEETEALMEQYGQ